jgi:hypothetical protein
MKSISFVVFVAKRTKRDQHQPNIEVILWTEAPLVDIKY